MSVTTATKPEARKAHVCGQCSRTIERGEQYHRVESVGYDGWRSWKCCRQCHQFGRDLYDAGVYDYDEYDVECHPYLPEARDNDPELKAWPQPWHDRWRLFDQQWRDRAGQLVPYLSSPAVPVDIDF